MRSRRREKTRIAEMRGGCEVVPRKPPQISPVNTWGKRLGDCLEDGMYRMCWIWCISMGCTYYLSLVGVRSIKSKSVGRVSRSPHRSQQ